MLLRLTRVKNGVKYHFNQVYYKYGLLCATHPLPMIVTSVLVVILCSLPMWSLPAFEQTATFLFGRIQLENYQTNVSLLETIVQGQPKPYCYVQQVHFKIEVSADMKLDNTNTWTLLQQYTPIQNLTKLLQSVQGENKNLLSEICVETSRAPFFKSPQTRLIFPKGRCYRELKRWFPKRGCFIIGPSAISGMSERKLEELQDSFKELVFGIPFNTTGIGEGMDGDSHNFFFTYTFFLTTDDNRFYSLLKDKLVGSKVQISRQESNKAFHITYYPVENSGPVELIPLTVTYLLVFVYLLFSVAKLEMLKSRWGLAFAAVMTIVLSLAMAVGLCAFFDVIPNTMTMKEIFPYLVIVIGLENVLIITKSVLSTPVGQDVIFRVATGMGNEGWYMTKTVLVEMLILACGYYTRIASLQEFCTFACVGVLSDFFLQLVFFTPVLAVDIRRAEISDLERTLHQELIHVLNLRIEGQKPLKQPTRFAPVGDNTLQPKTSSPEELRPVIPLPSPLEAVQGNEIPQIVSRRLKVLYFWARTRIVQRAFMVGCVVYISFVVYQQLNEKAATNSTSQETTSEQDYRLSHPTIKASEKSVLNTHPEHQNFDRYRCLGEDERSNASSFYSWQFLCKQHWPEVFAYYHISLKKWSLHVLPQINVTMNLHLSAKDLHEIEYLAGRMNGIFIRRALITTAVLVCLGTMVSLVWLCCTFCRKSRRDTKDGGRVSRISVTSLPGHTHRIQQITSSGSYVVSYCLNGSIRVWDPVADRCLLHFDRRKLLSVDCSVDESGLPGEWDPELLTEYEQHVREAVNRVCAPNIWCLSASGATVAAGCSNGNLEVFSLRRRKRLCIFNDDTAGVTAVKVSSRFSVIVGRKDGLVDFLEVVRARVDSFKDIDSQQHECYITHLDVSEGLCNCILRYRVKAHSYGISTIESTGGKVLTSCVDGSFKVYNSEDRVCIFALPPQGSLITSSSISTENQFLALLGYESGTFYMLKFPPSRGVRSTKYTRHGSAIMSVRADDDYIYTLGTDNVIHISKIKDDAENTRIIKSEEQLYSIEVLGEHTVVAVGENILLLIDGSTGTVIESRESRNRSMHLPFSGLVCTIDNSSIAVARGKKLDIYRFPFLVNKRD